MNVVHAIAVSASLGVTRGQANLRALCCQVQAVQPDQRLMDFIGFKTYRRELAAQLWQFGAGIALPVVFINVDKYFKHAFNITGF